MKNRYYVVKEFFGARIYDHENHSEIYLQQEELERVLQDLQGEYIEINNEERDISSPLKISMNITRKCNLKCIQCFSDSGVQSEDELTKQELFSLFDTMRKKGTFFICLGGGEPFIRDDIMEILKYGASRVSVSVVSNGLLIDNERIKELNKFNLDTLWISFEGLKDNHERLRGKGTFEKAVDALKRLKDYSGKTAIRMSVNRFNIGDMKGIVELAENNDIQIVRFTPLLSFGRADGKGLTINNSEYKLFLSEAKKINSELEIVHPDTVNEKKFWINPDNFGCHCGKEAVWIDEVGNYSPCIFWGDDYWVGNIRSNDWDELWERAKLASCIKGNATCKKCSRYASCRGGCRARALFEYGNLDDVDPLCPLL